MYLVFFFSFANFAFNSIQPFTLCELFDRKINWVWLNNEMLTNVVHPDVKKAYM